MHPKPLLLFQTLLLALLMGGLFACGGHAEENTALTTDTTQTSALQPTRGLYFSEEEQIILSKYFSSTLIEQFSDNMYAFRDAQSDADFAKAFETADSLQEILIVSNNDKQYLIQEELQAMDTVTAPYFSSCLEECMEFTYNYSIPALSEFARKTQGNSDDSFCALMKIACGEEDTRKRGHYKFFELTMDYCGGSLLGNGTCLEFLKKSWEHRQITPLFKTPILMLREACLSDMNHNIYMLDKESVLAELQAILDGRMLSTEEQRNLQTLYEQLAKEDSGLQFGCGLPDNTCNYGC